MDTNQGANAAAVTNVGSADPAHEGRARYRPINLRLIARERRGQNSVGRLTSIARRGFGEFSASGPLYNCGTLSNALAGCVTAPTIAVAEPMCSA